MESTKRIVFLLVLLACGCEHTHDTLIPAGDADANLADGAQLDGALGDAGLAADASKPAPSYFVPVRLDCACADRLDHTFCAPVTCLDMQDSDRECRLLCARAGARTGAVLGCGPACA